MYELFDLQQGPDQGTNIPPQWPYLKSRLVQNLKTVMDFYQQYPLRIDGKSLIQRILFALGIPRSLSIDRFYQRLQYQSLNTSMALQLTSSINKGRVFEGVFYGPGSYEIIIAHTTPFDYYQAETNWKELEPIKVLTHFKTDLELNVPNGTANNSESGLAVIAINLPMLAIQYRQWLIEDLKRVEATGENSKSISQYIFGYALTNMLPSHLDHAIFNRLYHRIKNYPLATSLKKHSFYLTDYSAALNQFQDQEIYLLERQPKMFDGVLRSIPLISCSNLMELSVLPEMVPTRQVIWGLAASRLKLIDFLYVSQFDNPRIRNGTNVNRIEKAFRLWRTDAALHSSLPVNLYYQLDEIISSHS